MIFVVDSNIVFAALLKDGATRGLLIDSPFTLLCPETLLSEIQKYTSEIITCAGFSEQEFNLLFALMIERIEIVEKTQYAHKMKEAELLIGAVDMGDVPFLALAFSRKTDGIWTENIKHFKQDKVRVWSTKQIIESVLDKTNLS